MSGFDSAAALLPKEIRIKAEELSPADRAAAQEFRLRLGRIPSVTFPDRERAVPSCAAVSQTDLQRVLESATLASPYAAAEGIRNGYVSAPGGVRVGLCGRMQIGTESAWSKRSLTSVAIRIPREVKGCGERFTAADFVSTLILSPPGAGKTTLLRDMIRLLSDRGARVALCDERGEVASLSDEGMGFDVGEHTDVLSDLPKHRAAMQLLKTMNPQILAMDEITAEEDIAACRQAAACGVSVLATAHAGSAKDLNGGLLNRSLLSDGLIHRLIWIRKTGMGREYREEFL